MSRDAGPLTEQQTARRALTRWAKIHAERNDVIRAAVSAGIDTRTIQQITGVARTTITRIMAAPDGRRSC